MLKMNSAADMKKAEALKGHFFNLWVQMIYNYITHPTFSRKPPAQSFLMAPPRFSHMTDKTVTLKCQ